MNLSVIVAVIISILPSVILGFYIYSMDKVEKEPKGVLFKLFLGGLGALFLTLIISDQLDLIAPNFMDKNNMLVQFYYNFIEVALVEEFCKWLLLMVGAWKEKNFNFLFDGVVYSVFVSLGFATLENIIYAISFKGDLTTLLLRAVLSVPAHAFFGVFMGYFFGVARMKKNKKEHCFHILLLSIALPWVLHGFFDFCLSGDNMIYAVVYLIFVLLLYILSLVRIKKMSDSDKYIK